MDGVLGLYAVLEHTLCRAFATLALLAFSWRASLVVATCTLLDVLGMVVSRMPDAGFWKTARLMLGLGAVTSL